MNRSPFPPCSRLVAAPALGGDGCDPDRSMLEARILAGYPSTHGFLCPRECEGALRSWLWLALHQACNSVALRCSEVNFPLENGIHGPRKICVVTSPARRGLLVRKGQRLPIPLHRHVLHPSQHGCSTTTLPSRSFSTATYKSTQPTIPLVLHWPLCRWCSALAIHHGKPQTARENLKNARKEQI